jgi:flagellin-like protein
MATILIIVLVLLALGAIPAWPYSRRWGYGPSGIIGLLLVVMIILALSGRL